MKLPIYQQKYALRAQRATGTDFGAPQAEATAQFAGGVSELNAIMEQASQLADQQRRNSVMIEAVARLNEKIEEIGQLPDWVEHNKRYDTTVKEVTQWAERQLADTRNFTRWQRDFASYAVRGRIRVKTQSLKVLKQATLAQNEKDLQTLASIAAQTDDSMEKQIAIEHGRDLLQQQLDSGIITHRERQQIEKAFLDDVAGAEIRALIRQHPVNAVKRLHDPKDPLTKQFDTAEREIWIDRALNAYEQDLRHQEIEARRQERIAEKARTKLAKTLAVQADTLSANDELTADWLYEHIHEMNTTDYRYHLERLTRQEREHNNNLSYVHLSDLAVQGVDVRQEADSALLYGDLSKDRRDKLHQLIERDIGKTVPWSQSTRQYINNHFGSDEILKAIPGGAQRKAEALFEWDKWISDHYNAATAQEGEEKAREILNNWQWKPTIMELFASERLRYGPDILTPNVDLSAIGLRTKQAYEKGEITKETMQEESRKLRRLSEIISRINNNE